jgi:16S rRNA (guanine527-N7)-methyltransferase
MVLPKARVTVAESQARKVAFLREVIRTLGLGAEVWPRRVEEMPGERRFDAVTLRAVEKMAETVDDAATRVREGGWMAALAGVGIEIVGAEEFLIPGSEQRRLLLWRNVPRGTSAS